MELVQRPHTVCSSIPKLCVQSEYVLKLIEEIELEANGPVSKPKPPRKDHMKENLKRLRDIQARAKQKQAEKQVLQPLKVSVKHFDVQEKDLKHKDDPAFNHLAQPSKPPKTAGPFRRPTSPQMIQNSNTRADRSLHRSLPQLNCAEDSDKMPELVDRSSKTSRNQVELEKSSQLAPTKTKSDVISDIRHRLGEIPTYLTERKKQWEAERERQIEMMREPPVPHGYTLLPDEERLETLELLRKNQEELVQSLAVLPVRNDTIRLRNYKEELERQLAKVEEGIKIFSRPKVLIKNDT